MSHYFRALALSFAFSLATTPALGASSAASSASESLTTSSGSASNSIQGSSNSSTQGNKVAQGEYRIVALNEVTGAATTVDVRLTALAGSTGEGSFTLRLPRTAFAQSGLAVGDAVAVQAREYGYSFANARTSTPFYLVLHDPVHRALTPRPVSFSASRSTAS